MRSVGFFNSLKFMKRLLPLLACTFLLAVTADGQRRRPSEFFPILDGGCWGFIDRSGKVIIEPQFGSALFFSGGLARVSPPVGEEIKGTWGYIDKSGTFVWLRVT